jgi:hypothetical protein
MVSWRCGTPICRAALGRLDGTPVINTGQADCCAILVDILTVLDSQKGLCTTAEDRVGDQTSQPVDSINCAARLLQETGLSQACTNKTLVWFTSQTSTKVNLIAAAEEALALHTSDALEHTPTHALRHTADRPFWTHTVVKQMSHLPVCSSSSAQPGGSVRRYNPYRAILLPPCTRSCLASGSYRTADVCSSYRKVQGLARTDFISAKATWPSLWACAYRLGSTKGGLGVAPFLGSPLARKTCN